MEARDLDEVAIPHKLRNAFSEINFIHGKVNKEPDYPLDISII